MTTFSMHESYFGGLSKIWSVFTRVVSSCIIYWNKRKFFTSQKGSTPHRTGLGTNMAAFSLFWTPPSIWQMWHHVKMLTTTITYIIWPSSHLTCHWPSIIHVAIRLNIVSENNITTLDSFSCCISKFEE